MKTKAIAPAPTAAVPGLNEVRFSLRELLVETEAEYQTGAFGQQKLHQEELSKLFAGRRRSRRAH